MATPEIMTIPEWTWTKIASAVNLVNLKRVSSTVSYYVTYRCLSDDDTEAPDPIVDKTIPDEAHKIFEHSNVYNEEFLSTTDIYILCANNDDDETDEGKIRVDCSCNSGCSVALCDSSNAIVTTSFEDNYRNMGYERVAENVITSLPENESYYVFDPTTVSDRGVFLLAPEYKVDEGPVTITFYRDTDYTGITNTSSYNPNFESDYEHQATLKSGATGTDMGTYVNAKRVGVEAGRFTNGNESTQGSKPFIIDATEKYLIVVDNDSGDTTAISYTFAWFELPIE